MNTHCMRNQRKQQGVVLLSLLLLLLAAGSYVLLRALNVGARAVNDESYTRSALLEARRALINYAIYKPALNLGPGRLPCPDLTGDGIAAGSCVLGGANVTTGRLPFVTLDSSRITDASGTDLWYAVADSHRNFLTTAINSDTGDTSDDLNLDGNENIVAIVFAPGSQLGAQNRSSGAAIADYLEGENSTLGDALFTAQGAAPFNDQIIVLTRQELMIEVENRVLMEVQNALSKYVEEYDGFPWPSPFADPSSSVFTESTSITEGHLAIHRDGEPFFAPFTLAWDIPVDGSLSSGTGPQDACMRSSECDDNDTDILYDFSLNPPLFPDGECLWSTAEMFNCSGTVTIIVADGKELKRKFAVQLNLSGISLTISDPSPSQGRKRSFTLVGAMPAGASGSITITDLLDDIPRGGPRTLSFTTGHNVEFSLQNVPFLLGDDSDLVSSPANSPAALPRWFTDNAWHQYVYYSFATAESFGGSGCTPGPTGDCLKLNSYSTDLLVPDVTLDDVRGVVLIAGPDSLTAPVRPSGNLGDYFEAENMTPGDNEFSQAPVNGTRNDQVEILNPNG